MNEICHFDVSTNSEVISDCCVDLFADKSQDTVDDDPYSLASAVKLHKSSILVHLPDTFHSQLVSLVQNVVDVVLSNSDVGDVRVEVEDEDVVKDLDRHEKPPKTLKLVDILILLSFGQYFDLSNPNNLDRFDGLESIVTIQLLFYQIPSPDLIWGCLNCFPALGM